MENIYYVHDANDGRLIITNIGDVEDDEECMMKIAEKAGIRWNDCEWGGVDSISINI